MNDQYVGRHSKRFQSEGPSDPAPSTSSQTPSHDAAPPSGGVTVLAPDDAPAEGTAEAAQPDAAEGTGRSNGNGATKSTPDDAGFSELPSGLIGSSSEGDVFATEPVTRAEHVRSERYKARRWVRTLSVVCIVILVLVAGAVGGLYVYAQRVWSAIPKIGSDELVLEEQAPGEPATFLIVGSDTREGLSDELSSAVGSTRQVGGQRADTIMIVHVDPNTRRSIVLSLPRDLRVKISGKGTDKINAAYSYDTQTLVDTVQDLTGLEVNHYAEINFQSFSDVVDALGGIEYCFANDVKDTKLKWKLPAGCHDLGGDQALHFVRSRHFHEKIDGRWKSDGTGDLGRITRQQEFVMKLLAKLNGAGSITNVNEYANIAKDYVILDEGFDLNTAIGLFNDMTPITPDRVEFVQLPYKQTMRDGISFMEMTDEGEEILARIRGEVLATSEPDTPGLVPQVQPGEVTIRVENGTRRAGYAGSTRDALNALGFSVPSIGDVEKGLEETKIVHAPGAAAKAELVKSYLGAGVIVVGDVSGADVVVVLGSDGPEPAAIAAPA